MQTCSCDNPSERHDSTCLFCGLPIREAQEDLGMFHIETLEELIERQEQEKREAWVPRGVRR